MAALEYKTSAVTMIWVSPEAGSQPVYPGASPFFPLKQDKNQGAEDVVMLH